MTALCAEIDIPLFFRRLSTANMRLLVLDYDGTLAPFQIRRADARPYPEVIDALRGVIDQGSTRVVIISGRALADLVSLLNGIGPLPELWGSHGWERRHTDGRVDAMPVPDGVACLLSRVREWAESAGLQDRCESKYASVAFHSRGLCASEAEEFEDRVRVRLATFSQNDHVEIRPFDGGLELRARGADKGTALATILAEAGPDTVAAYAGDDLTDEDAFRVLDGRGLRVLVRTELRPTEADVWLRPPGELVQFLSEWARVCGGQP